MVDTVLTSSSTRYTTYISGYDKCVRLLGQMRKSRKFTKFLDETRTDPECKGLDLMSFLIMPIQRIPRYELLLRELISCDDPDPQSEMAQAYNRVRYIAKHVNETQRHGKGLRRRFAAALPVLTVPTMYQSRI